ncbi:MAG: Outer membrane protein (OmpH-like) [Planctomycetes bacterium ADurb.Bin412]|nr:MAG: Outer membrane protein (OmpH-like) [Planctomycetes bacterium ADurb.Bin412]
MMKKATWMLTVLLGVWGYSFCLGQEAAEVAGPLKIGVVNVSRVLTECQENLDREKSIQEKQNQIKAKIQELETEANEIRNELENVLKPGSPESAARMQEWFNKMALKEAYEKGQMKSLETDTQVWTETLYQKFLDEVNRIARQKGLTLVLNKDEMSVRQRNLDDLLSMIRSRRILYSAPTLDLTAEVLENMDKAYEKEKAGK